jgi:hypothetical protein
LAAEIAAVSGSAYPCWFRAGGSGIVNSVLHLEQQQTSADGSLATILISGDAQDGQ